MPLSRLMSDNIFTDLSVTLLLSGHYGNVRYAFQMRHHKNTVYKNRLLTSHRSCEKVWALCFSAMRQWNLWEEASHDLWTDVIEVKKFTKKHYLDLVKKKKNNPSETMEVLLVQLVLDQDLGVGDRCSKQLDLPSPAPLNSSLMLQNKLGR